MTHRLSFVALLLGVALVARAAGPTVRSGAGFELEALPGRFNAEERPIWVDSQDRVVVQAGFPLSEGGGPFGTMRCIDRDGASHDLDDPSIARFGHKVLAARRGQDEFIFAKIHGSAPAELFRASCTGPLQPLGSYLFPTSLVPRMRAGNPWTLEADGSVYYPSEDGLARLALSPEPQAGAVVTNAAFAVAFGLPAGDVNQKFDILSVAPFPDGRLGLVVQGRVGTERLDAIVERSVVGALTVRWSRRTAMHPAWYPNATFDPGLGALLVEQVALLVSPHQTYVSLGVVPQTNPPDLIRETPRWPVFTQFLVRGSSGNFAFDGNATISRMTFDPALADFDRDGLRATQEALLGTSDMRVDSDHDGLGDLAEVRHLATDPADPSSTVQRSGLTDDVVLGASLFARYQPLGTPECRDVNRFSYGRVMCGCRTTNACMGPDFQPIPGADGVGLFPYAPASGTTPDVGFRFDDATGGWSSVEFASGAKTALPLVHVGANAHAVPLSATQLLVLDGSGDPKRIWRVSVNGDTFAVMDRERVDCPVLGSEAELSRCGAPELFSPTPLSLALVGFEPERKVALVAVTTDQGRSLWGVGETTVTYLADLTTATDGLDVTRVMAMSEAGARGYVLSLLRHEGGLGMRRLDAAFEPVPSNQPFLGQHGAGTFFERGFADAQAVSFLIEPLPSRSECDAAAGIFVCDSTRASSDPRWVPTGLYPAEWLPVAPALEKGEVVFWGGTRYAPSLGVPRNWRADGHDGNYGQEWILWRTTPLGATLEWLLEPDFKALLSPEDRSTLVPTPLGAITAMGASPDGLKLCLAESGATRVWELSLDPSTRVPRGIRLAATDAGAGCGYDEQGRLAVLAGSPTTIRWNGVTLPVADVAAPSGLHRFGGKWLVQAHGENARCVDDTGVIADPAVQLVALSAAPGGIAYIDVKGYGFLTTPERFCAGLPPLEGMASPEANVWSWLNEFQTFRSTNAVRGVMAMRPDGVAFMGISLLQLSGGSPGNSQVVTNVLFHLFPRFAQLDAAQRIEAVDPFRIALEVHGLAHLRATNIEAMTVVPGAAADRDWGYATRPGTPVAFRPPASAADGGTPPLVEPPAPEGCGCGGPGPSLAGLLVLLTARRRARRTTGRA